MPTESQDNLEMALLEYLAPNLATKNITILEVSINDIRFKALENVTSNSSRLLQRGDDDVVKPAATIDVTTNVNGQYRPPPEIDYSGVVEDAIDADPQQLEQSIRRKDTYFQILESIDSKPATTDESAPEITPPSALQTTSATLVVILICSIAAFVLFVGGTLYYRRKMRKRARMTNLFVEESELLKKPRKLFGGFGPKSHLQLDGVMTADVAWADVTTDDDWGAASYGKPQSLYEMRSVGSTHRNEPYAANQSDQFKDKEPYRHGQFDDSYGSGMESYNIHGFAQRQPTTRFSDGYGGRYSEQNNQTPANQIEPGNHDSTDIPRASYRSAYDEYQDDPHAGVYADGAYYDGGYAEDGYDAHSHGAGADSVTGVGAGWATG